MFSPQMFWRIFGPMLIKRITILLPLFIFGIVIQVWADTTGTLNETLYQGNIVSSSEAPVSTENVKFEVNSFLEILKANKKFKLIESIDKMISRYKLGETTWRYKFLDPQGVKETNSLNSELRQSTLKRYTNVNRFLEEGGAQVMFELLQSKLKRTEIFMLFRLSFNPKVEQMFLEMHLTPSSDKGVNFFIPF
jgi:hypothetical protein